VGDSDVPFIGRGTCGRFYGGQEADCRRPHSPRRSAEYGNSTDHDVPNRSAARARARAASTSRFRGSASVTSESRRCRATAATSVTARLTAASLARDGLLNPEIFRTNWREASRTSASVAGGSKLNNGLMFRHMSFGPEYREGRMWNILLLFRTRPRCEVGRWLVALPHLAGHDPPVAQRTRADQPGLGWMARVHDVPESMDFRRPHSAHCDRGSVRRCNPTIPEPNGPHEFGGGTDQRTSSRGLRLGLPEMDPMGRHRNDPSARRPLRHGSEARDLGSGSRRGLVSSSPKDGPGARRGPSPVCPGSCSCPWPTFASTARRAWHPRSRPCGPLVSDRGSRPRPRPHTEPRQG